MDSILKSIEKLNQKIKNYQKIRKMRELVEQKDVEEISLGDKA